MRPFRLAIQALYTMILAGGFGLLSAVQCLAQDSSVTNQSSGGVTSSTTTTTTTADWVSDWRLWAVVGAIVLVILVIAMTRGRGDGSTTIVK
jgi:hypothetical protein